MFKAFVGATVVLLLSVTPARAQRRGAGAGSGTVTFAVYVTDANGAALDGVDVNVSGPATRDERTEVGRIALENLPAGMYRFTFKKAGFIPLQRDVAARGRAPVEVKVALDPAPAPAAAPPAPVAALPPTPVITKPLALDLPTFIEKHYVGRSPQKTSELACSTGGPATLLQLNEAAAERTYPDADEFVYVIAGEGTAVIADAQDSLTAGTLLLIPRGTKHAFVPGPKKPLVMVSMLAGAACGK
jgi:mannose-6-phosphate isomerase-like protein (cupin superfamily)